MSKKEFFSDIRTNATSHFIELALGDNESASSVGSNNEKLEHDIFEYLELLELKVCARKVWYSCGSKTASK